MFELESFSEKLEMETESGKLSEKTKRYYLEMLEKLDTLCDEQEAAASATVIEDAISRVCNGTKQFNKCIAAVKKYERLVLHKPGALLYGEPLSRLRDKVAAEQNGGKEIRHPEQTYEKKINRLNNERLKLAFRLQEKSGLRIAEIAALTPGDIQFDDGGGMIIHVRNGKGRKAREVTVQKDLYLSKHLPDMMKGMDSEQRLFYSGSYLMKKAHEHHMETHDLRRINARRRFREARDEGEGKRAAARLTAKQLGHVKTSTTKLYLGKEWRER